MYVMKKWFPLIAFGCGILALVMICCPALNLDGDNWSGLEVCFGKKYVCKVSVVNILTYVLATISGVFAVIGAKKEGNMLQYIAIVGFVAAMVLFFMTKNFLQFDGISGTAKEDIKKALHPAIGSILASFFCLLGAAATICDVVVKDY